MMGGGVREACKVAATAGLFAIGRRRRTLSHIEAKGTCLEKGCMRDMNPEVDASCIGEGERNRNQGLSCGEGQLIGEYKSGRLEGDIELSVVEQAGKDQEMNWAPWAVTN
jgi:hypothetical protein